MKKTTRKMSKDSLRAVSRACIISHCEKMPYDVNRGHSLVHATGRMFRYPADGTICSRWWPEHEDTLSWCR